MTWENGDDVKVRRELANLSQMLDRMRRLKRGGVSAFPGGIAVLLGQLVSDLKTIGVFVVPVGELEEWLAAANITESKANKWAWASAAAQHVQQRGSSSGDVWDFMRDVGRHLMR
jgi:hypothetical protein